MSYLRTELALLVILLSAGCAMQRGTTAPASGPTGPSNTPPPPQYYPTTEPAGRTMNRPPNYASPNHARPPYRSGPRAPRPTQSDLLPVSANLPVKPQSKLDLEQPTQIIARVGDQPILLGDLLGEINQMVAPYEGKMPKAELDRQKEMLVQRFLKAKIDTKLMYLDFLRELPDPTKLPDIEQEVTNVFNDRQLDSLLDKASVNTRGEYDLYLRQFGSSLEKTRKDFIEQVLAIQARKGQIDNDPEITHQEMLDLYHANLKDYEIPAKVRWEKLTVRRDRFSSREEAWRAIAMMGNEVQGGAPLDAVARRSSQGFKAKQGGYHDWTSQGSLASEELDEAIFTLPPNQLSWIIDDGAGFHIVRVLERTPATHVPFTEAQVKIKKTLLGQKIKARQDEYVKGLRERTPIWTIFDKPSQPERTAEGGGEFTPSGGAFQVR